MYAAGCSINFEVSRVAFLENGVQNLRIDGKVGFVNVINKAELLFFRRNRYTSRSKKLEGFHITYSLEPQPEPQASAKAFSIGNYCALGFDPKVLKSEFSVNTESGKGGGFGNGASGNDGGNGKLPHGGGDDGEEGDREDDEFGPILKFEEIMKETKARGATLPSDMLQAAEGVGLRKIFLLRYLEMQEFAWPLGFAMKSWTMLRNRMLADPNFLFKVGTEIVIDSCCATFAEAQKRGKDFWAEFELFMADLLVGMVVSVALIGMLAPYARIGQPLVSQGGLLGRMQMVCGALPSSVFEAQRPGCIFSMKQRVATYFYKGVLYGSVGFVCGIVGQGIANIIMIAKRSINKSDEDIPVPPLVKSAALWGVFLAVSSNTRYQIVNGLERVVESSAVAKQLPPIAMAFTVGIRFANNVYGGMQFVDWARWSGVQSQAQASQTQSGLI